MTFRITIDQESGIHVVRLAGWLEGEDVTRLEQVVSDASDPLRLDVTELRSADQDGMSLLRALHARGIPFVGASPFIRLLVGIEPARPPPSDGEEPRQRKL